MIASLAHDEISFAKVAELIEKDTVLAGAIMRLVNSPLYGMRASVSSVRHAVSLLGVNKLRNAVLSVSGAQMWRALRTPPEWSMAGFNRHAVSVAILSDLLAQELPVNDCSGAFVAGLFHAMGLLLIAVGLPTEYRRILMLCGQEPGRALEHELAVLGTTHAELSAEALVAWNLPRPIREAVRYHIQPELEPAAGVARRVTLSRILHSADAYVRAKGAGFSILEDNTIGPAASLESLGLGDALPVVLSEFDNELANIQPYF